MPSSAADSPSPSHPPSARSCSTSACSTRATSLPTTRRRSPRSSSRARRRPTATGRGSAASSRSTGSSSAGALSLSSSPLLTASALSFLFCDSALSSSSGSRTCTVDTSSKLTGPLPPSSLPASPSFALSPSPPQVRDPLQPPHLAGPLVPPAARRARKLGHPPAHRAPVEPQDGRRAPGGRRRRRRCRCGREVDEERARWVGLCNDGEVETSLERKGEGEARALGSTSSSFSLPATAQAARRALSSRSLRALRMSCSPRLAPLYMHLARCLADAPRASERTSGRLAFAVLARRRVFLSRERVRRVPALRCTSCTRAGCGSRRRISERRGGTGRGAPARTHCALEGYRGRASEIEPVRTALRSVELG